MSEPLYLLGAGASVDAGLPPAARLTELLLRRVEDMEGRDSGVAQALRHAVAAMVRNQTRPGGDPLAPVDAERLFSAIHMLSDSESLEIAPFVSSWDAAPELQDEFGYRPSPYPDVQRALLRALQEILLGGGEAEYLGRLAHSAPRVATLNYDMKLEQAAAAAGLSVDTGVASWTGGISWNWGSADVHLLKLHGSLSWRPTIDDGSWTPDSLYGEIDPLDPEDFQGLDENSIVFGSAGKLRPEGPFLSMLYALNEWLQQAKHLIVVGYSFRDEHINTLINDWLSVIESPRMTIVDPAMPTWAELRDAKEGKYSDWLYSMLDYEHYQGHFEGCAPWPYAWQRTGVKLDFQRLGAREWVSRDLGQEH